MAQALETDVTGGGPHLQNRAAAVQLALSGQSLSRVLVDNSLVTETDLVSVLARQLGQSGRLDQETYDAAHRFLGDAGMVELVSLCGYYTLISYLLNAFTVPLPPGTTPMWDGS